MFDVDASAGAQGVSNEVGCRAFGFGYVGVGIYEVGLWGCE